MRFLPMHSVVVAGSKYASQEGSVYFVVISVPSFARRRVYNDGLE